MNRLFSAFFSASAVALLLGACDDGNYGPPNGGYAVALAPPHSECRQYTTCGSCTPVPGCGWCFNTAGGGCARQPDECSQNTEFTWTWDPSGCPGVDASVVAIDAGAPVDDDASSTGPDANHDAAPEATVSDGATTDGIAPAPMHIDAGAHGAGAGPGVLRSSESRSSSRGTQRRAPSFDIRNRRR